MTAAAARSLRLRLVQPRLWRDDDAANFAHVRRIVGGPPLDDALRPSLVVLPELLSASMARGEYVAAVGALAAEHGAWVVGGKPCDPLDRAQRRA